MNDNRILNIHGKGYKLLKQTLELAFSQVNLLCTGWIIDEKYGLILLWYVDGKANSFPYSITSEEIINLSWNWLAYPNSNQIKMIEEVDNYDNFNNLKWKIYYEDRIYVYNSRVICVINRIFK